MQKEVSCDGDIGILSIYRCRFKTVDTAKNADVLGYALLRNKTSGAQRARPHPDTWGTLRWEASQRWWWWWGYLGDRS